MYSVTRFKVQQ